MVAAVSTSFAFSISLDKFAVVLTMDAPLIRSQTLELSKPVSCTKAAHEPCEQVRVGEGCRRLFLNPGDLRWREMSFRHATDTHYKTARLSIYSATVFSGCYQL